MYHKTRAISEGAMMLSIIGILLLVSRQMGNFLEILFYFISIPIIIYSVRYGMRMSIIVCVCTCVLSFLFSTITSWFYIGSALGSGILYSYGMQKQWNNRWLLSGQIIVNILTTMLTVLLFASFFGYNLQDEVRWMLEVIPSSTQSGGLQQYVMMCVLLSYVIIALMQGIIIHILTQQLLARLQLPHRTLKSLQEIRFPRSIAYALMIAMVVYLISLTYGQENSQQVCLFMVTILLVCTSANGVLYVLKRYGRKGKMLTMFTILMCFLPITRELLAGIGIYAMWQPIN